MGDDINHLLPILPIDIDGINSNVVLKIKNKLVTRSFSATATSNRIWDFVGAGKLQLPLGDYYILASINPSNVSGKLKEITLQIRTSNNDDFSDYTSSYSGLTNNNSDNILYKDDNYISITNYSITKEFQSFELLLTLEEANGEDFTDEIYINYFAIVSAERFSLDEKYFPQIKEFREIKELVDSVDLNLLDDVYNAKEQLILSTTDDMTFIQGDIISSTQNYSVNSSYYHLRTRPMLIDFAYCEIEHPENIRVAVFAHVGDDKSKTRNKGNKDTYMPLEDEMYFSLVLSIIDNDNGNTIRMSPNSVDVKSIKIKRYSKYDIPNKLLEQPLFSTSLYYRDKLLNNAAYWVYHTDSETSIKHRYCEERINDILSYPGIPVLFITDTHWRTNSSSKFSWDLCGYIANRTYCRNIVYGGDALTQHATVNEGKAQLRNEIQEFKLRFNNDFKYVFGNHDANCANVGSASFPTPAETYRIPYKDIYDICVKYLEGFVKFEPYSENITNVEEYYRHRLHYYYDDATNRIRYIVMDSGTRYDALSNGGTPTRLQYQYDWLAKVLKDTPKGYHIMVFTHQFWSWDDENNTVRETIQGVNVCKILAAYRDGTIISSQDSVISFEYDFTNSNMCPIIAMVIGHVHRDYIGTLYGINNIITTCDAIDKTTHPNTEMEAGTRTEHAFDLIKIDKFRRYIKCFRIGAGEDREIAY